MPKLWASIDLGTHTARLLVAEIAEAPATLRPRVRKREYISLGKGFDPAGENRIQSDAISRALKVVTDFRDTLQALGVEAVYGVATGVVREAANRDVFLTHVYKHTGIRIQPIGGTEEATLTGMGALHFLDVQTDAVVVFDLGGGSTEFYFRSGPVTRTASVPLGTVVLAQTYLKSDPPTLDQVEALSQKTRDLLERAHVGATADVEEARIVGTGGTVTAVAAMLAGVRAEEITPERLQGRVIERFRLDGLVRELLGMTAAERLVIPALDAGKAEVIPAGALIVKEIMRFYNAKRMITSMGDLLEGNLLQYLEDETNG
jgi:exopolyphosphatase/guanosine-5'-triphosphate,3'-diphosphate pyrophosphatase